MYLILLACLILPRISLFYLMPEIDILFGVSIESSPELVRRCVSSTRYVLCALWLNDSYMMRECAIQVINDIMSDRYE